MQNLLKSTSSRGGETGRRARFRIVCRKAWRFDSSPRHQKIAQILKSAEVSILATAARAGSRGLDWDYESVEDHALLIWQKTAWNIPQNEPLIRPIIGISEDKIFEFSPTLKDSDGVSYILLEFVIAKGEIKFSVQVNKPKSFS